MKKIGYSAFEGCVNLQSVKISQTVKCVCADAFTDSGIKEPIYNASGDQLIYCPKEAAGEIFTVPTGVRIIKSTAFRNMPKLKEVIFPDGLESICPTAFYKCGLEKIRIPASVKNISNGAFIHCDQLKEIIWEEERDFFQENLEYFRITGKEPVVPYSFPLPRKHYWEKEEFKALAEKCGKADPAGMEEMAYFFKMSQKNTDSEFFQSAERFWYFRAYLYGSEKGKDFLCKWMKRHPKQQMPVPYLSKNFSASVNGLCLKALGFLFFEDRDYKLDGIDKDGVVLAKSWAGDDGPDEDGYGMEEFYDWWYLDDCLNFLPGTTCFKYYSYLDRRARKKEFMDAHDQVADMIRRR